MARATHRRNRHSERGAAAVEAALTLPLLALFLAGGASVGQILYVQHRLENVARTVATAVSMSYYRDSSQKVSQGASLAVQSGNELLKPLADACPGQVALSPVGTRAMVATVSCAYQGVLADLMSAFGMTPPTLTASATFPMGAR